MNFHASSTKTVRMTKLDNHDSNEALQYTFNDVIEWFGTKSNKNSLNFGRCIFKRKSFRWRNSLCESNKLFNSIETYLRNVRHLGAFVINHLNEQKKNVFFPFKQYRQILIGQIDQIDTVNYKKKSESGDANKREDVKEIARAHTHTDSRRWKLIFCHSMIRIEMESVTWHDMTHSKRLKFIHLANLLPVWFSAERCESARVRAKIKAHESRLIDMLTWHDTLHQLNAVHCHELCDKLWLLNSHGTAHMRTLQFISLTTTLWELFRFVQFAIVFFISGRKYSTRRNWLFV